MPVESAKLERAWFLVKNNNYLYYMNKFISFAVAATLAAITIWYRSSFFENLDDACPTENYAFIFWYLFIYYSF